MSQTTKARSLALARVSRLVVAARRHGEQSVTLKELELALEGVEVERLARPRPCAVANVGRRITAPGVISHTQRPS